MLNLFGRKVHAKPQVGPSVSVDVKDLLRRADALRETADSAGALDLYQRAFDADPKCLHAIYWLATLHEEAENLPAAKQYCDRGLAIEPDQIGLLLRFGSVAVHGNDPSFAVKCFERVRELDPEIPDLDAPIADQYCLMGRVEEGLAAFDRAIARHPEAVFLRNNRLFVLNFSKTFGPVELFKEHRRWGEWLESRTRTMPTTEPVDKDPEKRLRIGYVSSDFRDHAVAAFFEPLLEAHDRNAFEIFCFNTSSAAEDVVAARLKRSADVWHNVGQLDDQALADTIRKSQIDILVDLAGHTNGNRLTTFAMKPSPIQVTWLGYLNTTGLTTMDYRVTDGYLDPIGETEHLHTETLWRLPHHSCFRPSPQSPPVTALPATANGYITFGSMNQWPKVSDEVKDTWTRLLKRVDRSRLLIVARGGQNSVFRDRIIGEFVLRGIEAARIHVSPALDFLGFLRLFGEIDISLDPFPYGGGTTTMQSLWMGVPVVTLRGTTAFARNSVGLLSAVGLTQLVARTPDAYVVAGAELAGNLLQLAEIRARLRDRVAASGLTDARRFSGNLELAYRSMWRKYCAARENSLPGHDV
jgi:protein O-GlcNAc transferase